jgi:hypothetical protein
MMLVANTYVNYVLSAEMRAHEFEVIGRVVTTVPLRRVRASTNLSKISELCETIASDARHIQKRNAINTFRGDS